LRSGLDWPTITVFVSPDMVQASAFHLIIAVPGDFVLLASMVLAIPECFEQKWNIKGDIRASL
jgi:hypothetical protein